MLTALCQIQARTAYLPQLQAQKNDYLSDIAKFNQLLGELQTHKNDVEGKISSRKSKLKTLEVQIASTTSDIESLKERVATQELSPEDVKRMVEKHENMEEVNIFSQVHIFIGSQSCKYHK